MTTLHVVINVSCVRAEGSVGRGACRSVESTRRDSAGRVGGAPPTARIIYGRRTGYANDTKNLTVFGNTAGTHGQRDVCV